MARHRIPRVRTKAPDIHVTPALPPEQLGPRAEPVALSDAEIDEEPETEQEVQTPRRHRRLYFFPDEEDLFDWMGF